MFPPVVDYDGMYRKFNHQNLRKHTHAVEKEFVEKQKLKMFPNYYFFI